MALPSFFLLCYCSVTPVWYMTLEAMDFGMFSPTTFTEATATTGQVKMTSTVHGQYHQPAVECKILW